MKKLLVLTLMLFGCSEYQLQHETHTVNLIGDPPQIENTWRINEFDHPEPDPVDILFVIDNSCSMRDNQSNLDDNINDFFETMSKYWLDYRVGVTSTDNTPNGYSGSNSGKIQGYDGHSWVSPYSGTYTPGGLFERMHGAVQSLHGFREAGIDATWAVFHKEKQHNKDFFRQDAPLHIIMLTDEDDQSQHITPLQLTWFLETELQPWKRAPVSFHSVVTRPPSPRRVPCAGTSAESVGDAYTWVTRYAGGLTVDICDTDWSKIWEAISAASADKTSEYVLHQHPVEESIEVYITEGDLTYGLFTPEDWFYDSRKNSVVFNEWQHEVGQTVRIEYWDQTLYENHDTDMETP